MSRTKLTAIALTAAFATACLATSAYALAPKECLPMAEMNAALKAEGHSKQRDLHRADRLEPSYREPEPGNRKDSPSPESRVRVGVH